MALLGITFNPWSSQVDEIRERLQEAKIKVVAENLKQDVYGNQVVVVETDELTAAELLAQHGYGIGVERLDE